MGTLSLGVQRGSKFSVGGDHVEVTRIHHGGRMAVRVGSVEHEVSETEKTLILPDVYVSYGRNVNSDQAGARIAFDAPIHIRIRRIQ